MTWKQSRELTEALRVRGPSAKHEPTEHDRPPLRLPGPKARPLPGQLNLADELENTTQERRDP
jgi:hypothetical protein